LLVAVVKGDVAKGNFRGVWVIPVETKGGRTPGGQGKVPTFTVPSGGGADRDLSRKARKKESLVASRDRGR